jgi:hypothetical protein
MFTPEDFVLPLEKELRLKVIDQEIRSCDDLKELQSQLIRVTKLFMTHQHLLDRCLEQLLAIEADKLLVEGLEDCDASS